MKSHTSPLPKFHRLIVLSYFGVCVTHASSLCGLHFDHDVVLMVAYGMLALCHLMNRHL